MCGRNITDITSFLGEQNVSRILGRKKKRLYIFPQYHASFTQPIKYKESHIFAIFVSVLTTFYCMSVRFYERW